MSRYSLNNDSALEETTCTCGKKIITKNLKRHLETEVHAMRMKKIEEAAKKANDNNDNDNIDIKNIDQKIKNIDKRLRKLEK